MKRTLVLLAVFCAGIVSGPAQIGPGPGGAMTFGGARFDAMMAKLFGTNSAFQAVLEVQSKDPRTSDTVVIPGKLSFLEGRSRFAVDISEARGGKMPPGAGAQLKTMGMSEMIVVSRPDKRTSYLIYPGLEGYVEQSVPEKETLLPADQIKVEAAEAVKETLDGHECAKSKAVVTVGPEARFEVTVWRAADLRGFPIRVEVADAKFPTTLSFKDVAFVKPAAEGFAPPAGYERHASPQALFQKGMMRMLGGGK